MAIERDWRNSSKYYLSPEQESAVETRSIARYGADVQICFNLLVEIYELKPSDLRRMIDYKVWRMKQKMEEQGERF